MRIGLSRLLLIAVILILPAIFSLPVMADNNTLIKFSDQNLAQNYNIEIFGLNSTSGNWERFGLFNSSSILTFAPGSYNVVIEPSQVQRFANVETLAGSFLIWFETNYIVLTAVAIFFVMIALAFGGRRRK